MYVRRGIGADCAYEGDPTCSGPCVPLDFVGPLPEGSVYCAPAAIPVPGCYPITFSGPLPPGSSYCSGAGTPTFPGGSGCPAGSTCSIFPGVPNVAVYVMGAIVASFLFLGVVHK